MRRNFWLKLLLSGLLAATLALAGCADDGDTGPAGPAGPPGPPGAGLQANETCTVCHAANRIADVEPFHAAEVLGSVSVTNITPSYVDNAGVVTVSVDFDFAATDVNGNPVTVDLTTLATGSTTNLAYIRFSLATLVPGISVGIGEPDTWYDYVTGERVQAQLVDNGAGNYTYTFNAFNAANSARFLAALGDTHRIAFQVSGMSTLGLAVANPYLDFRPDGALVTLTRDIVRIEACNECHDPLAFHGGGRIDTAFCVVCHNPTLAINPNGLAEGDMAYMIHKIHNSGTFLTLDGAISYAEVTYPQDLRNCTKCHVAAAADADNWKAKPYIVACSSCHEAFDATVHQGGVTNADCATCHTIAAIETSHATENATANNPAVPAGASNFEYVIDSVTATAAGDVTIAFHINRDGVPMDLPATRPAGLSGGPSFLFAYAQAQDGITAPADYNNLGRSAGQPASQAIYNTAGALQLTLTGTSASYTFTKTAAFPAGATLRAVGLQGYFTQVGILPDGPDAGTAPDDLARHTQSVVKAVTGDTARRAVVKSSGCAECHEIFEGHGGNRVLTANGGVEICLLCHNPNLSTSGRGADPANINATNQALLTAHGYDPANPLTFPEATNNFKDMIHGIHSVQKSNAGALIGPRTQDYDFVRDRGTSGVFYYNWSEVTYPGRIANCSKCHIGNSFRPENIPATALVTTNVTTNGTVPMSRTAVAASRASVPNATDEVISKLGATCYSCHTSPMVVDHMNLNGAASGNRSDVTGQ